MARSSDGSSRVRGPGSDKIVDRGLGRNETTPRGPGSDRMSPESDRLKRKR